MKPVLRNGKGTLFNGTYFLMVDGIMRIVTTSREEMDRRLSEDGIKDVIDLTDDDTVKTLAMINSMNYDMLFVRHAAQAERYVNESYAILAEMEKLAGDSDDD